MSVLLNPELPPETVLAAVTFLAGKDHHPFAIRASVSGARECLESLGDMLVKAETHIGVLQVHQATFEGSLQCSEVLPGKLCFDLP